MENIISALRELGIDQYVIEEKKTDSLESFFIRKNLDLKRRSETLDRTVTVYRPFEKDGQKMLGDSTVSIHPGMTPAEIRQALEEAYYAASLVANPWYEPPAAKREDPKPAQGGFAGRSMEESLKVMTEALFAEDTAEDVFLNSSEIFMRRIFTRIVTSQGADVAYETNEVWGEYVCQCPAPQDVETYHQFSYREPEVDAFRQAVKEALEMTRARAQANQAPKTGEYSLILSGGEHMKALFSYYVDRAASGMVYQKYSTFAIGDHVQGEDVSGDKLTVDLKATEPYTGFGVPMIDRPLLEEGVLKTIHGGARFAYYLGIEPTGNYKAIHVPTGSTPMKELEEKPYLHVMAFSDFQMNAFSGHFGGEIRLAFLYDGQTVTPVTGGSVNGSIHAAQGHMTFSQERCRTADYDGPLAVRIEGIKVAGA